MPLPRLRNDTVPRQPPYPHSVSIPSSLLLLTMVLWSQISPLVSHLIARKSFTDAGFHPYPSLMPSLQYMTPPYHPFWYLRVISVYSTVVQLYARHVWSTPPGGVQTWCRFGCSCREMVHHIFDHCHHFSEMHEQAARDFCSAMFRLSEVETTPLTREVYLHSARHLFNDDSSVGPKTLSHFYLGKIPLVASSESSPPAFTPRRIANITLSF